MVVAPLLQLIGATRPSAMTPLDQRPARLIFGLEAHRLDPGFVERGGAPLA